MVTRCHVTSPYVRLKWEMRQINTTNITLSLVSSIHYQVSSTQIQLSLQCNNINH